MIGTVAGNFKILQEIGEGGMGKVYKGVDTMLDREVAIKVLRPELVSHAHLVERFRSEAMTLAKLNHPNIALLYAFFQQEQHFYMVLEFVRGETLDKRMRRLGIGSYEIALRHFLYTLEAIGYAHSMGVVHRDIKPSNVMITETDDVKVMDFGIARVLGSERMTREGSMIGTPEYMAPEQIRGMEVDPRTDIYALGILLFEMLTGRLPFMSQNHFELMRAHIEMAPPSPRSYVPQIPVSLEQIILKALAKKKEDRFATAFEFRDAILGTPELVAAMNQSARATQGGKSAAFPVSSNLGRYSQGGQPAATGSAVTADRAGATPADRMTMDARQFEAQRNRAAASRPLESGSTQVIPASPGAGKVSQTGFSDEPAPKSKLPLIAGGAVGAILLVGALWYFTQSGAKDPAKPGPGKPAVATVNIKPDLVALTGGTFKMGRNDDPQGEEDEAWAYLQMPANTVTVLPFLLDRTEVSNLEYAQFVKEESYPPPSDWNGNEPFPGQEKWPVRNVSYDDAVKFAAWRSKRDKTNYRLPTEEEWEYAARNGGKADTTVFPWGNVYEPLRANINKESTTPKNVDSYPEGKTEQGVLNLIGNVGEWTSTNAKYYDGNDKLAELDAIEQQKMVVRGGSYISEPTGIKPLRLTVRGFEPKDKKSPIYGFRLVREP